MLLVLVLLVAGCGGSSDDAASGTSTTTPAPTTPSTATPATVAASTTTQPKDPCTNVTTAEVASATGKTVTAAMKANDFLCNYTTSDTGVVNVSVAGPIEPASVEQNLKAETAAGTVPPTMPGLGDAAYQTLGGVEVVKGTTAIRISVFGSGTYADPGNAAAVTLARLILGRI
jgi:hypothetical protein